MKKYDRFYIKNLDIEKLYDIFTNLKYDLFFIGIVREGVIYRYKTSSFNSIDEFYFFLNKNSLRRFESGINSDDINIYDADFIDCYPSNKNTAIR